MQLSNLNKNPVAWYTSGTILRQLTAFIMLPIYTQYLTPAEYGIVGMLAAILAVYELFLGARFGAALPKFYFDKDKPVERHRLISSALLATAGTSAIGAVLFALSSSLLAEHFFERSDLVWALAAYGITLLTSSVEEYALVFLRLRDKPFFFFVISITKMVIQLSLNMYFLVGLGMGVQGVIYAGVIASALMALVSAYYIIRICGLRFDWAEIRALLHFTWPLWLSGLGAVYIQFIINYLLKQYASLEELGLYHFGLKFSTLIAMMIWRPFNQWWQTERFKVARQADNPKAQFAGAFMLVATAMCVGAFGISIFAGSVIELMADPAYMGAANIIPVLCATVVIGQLNLFMNFAFLKTGRTGFFPKLRFIKAILITLMMWQFTSHWQLQGAVYAILLSQTFEFVGLYAIGQRYYDQGLPMKTFVALYTVTFAAIFIAQGLISSDMAFWPRNGMNVVALLAYIAVLAILLFGLTRQGTNVTRFVRRKAFQAAPN